MFIAYKMSKSVFADRIKELRKKKGFSQAELAEAMGVHFAQVSRYERGETKPNAEAMTKLAQVLETSTDFLMNGTTNETAVSAGLDKEMISRFRQVQDLNADDKKTVLSFLDAFIAKGKIQNILK